jgi:hypothetical protein
MGMTPLDYFEGFVRGNRDDCDNDPACLRRAFNAAVSATHLADHYYEYYFRRRPTLVRGQVDAQAFGHFVAGQTGGAYADIRSITNAYKHLYERKKRSGPQWTIGSAGSLDLVEFAQSDKRLAHMMSDYQDDSQRRFVVIFRRRDGTQGEFLPTLDKVIDYWEQKLY